MPTITNTGNFMARPNRHDRVGVACECHFHRFDHTVLPLSGLWLVQAWEWTEDRGDAFDDAAAPFIGERDVGPHLFAAARPDLEVAPWLLVRKHRWHRIHLVSKEMKVGDQVVELPGHCEFWCCWSYRTPDGYVVEYDTGWPGQIG